MRRDRVLSTDSALKFSGGRLERLYEPEDRSRARFTGKKAESPVSLSRGKLLPSFWVTTTLNGI